MKTLYLDCSMGAAGDMLNAALLELLPDPQAFVRMLNELQFPMVEFKADQAFKCGIRGTDFSVMVQGMLEDEHIHEHEENLLCSDKSHHHNLKNIQTIIHNLSVSEKIKQDILHIYQILAEAESQVHGVPIENIHFHEVGTMDAIADITACCLLIEELAPEQIIASPIHVGSGYVKCAHGQLPVPTPATAYILKNIPIYGGAIQAELCTPTGAALLKYFVDQFIELPQIKIKKIGYGMGKKDFLTANCIRALWGESAEQSNAAKNPKTDQSNEAFQADEMIIELSCNLDDMTSEEIGFALDILLENGAKDVYTIPIGMKKSRLATLLCVLCDPAEKEKFIALLFQYTTTLGIREKKMKRYILQRQLESVETEYGQILCKKSSGYGVVKSKYEYEDLAKIAKKEQLSLQEIKEKLSDHQT